MATNKYFNLYNRKSEQDLVEDLIIESIKIHGIDTYYLPRSLQKEDLIFGEDALSKFDDWYEIEVYIKNVDGFEGQGDLFRKFGLEVQDQATLLISRSRFAREVGDEIQPPRPREGDLILFPENDALMEIKFVSNEKFAFYQGGEFHVYQVEVQQFAYSHEELETGIPEVDQIQDKHAYQLNAVLGAGSGTYEAKEQVYQGASLASATAKAEVIEQDNPIGTVTLVNIVGELQSGVALIGETSGANYVITVNDQDILKDASAKNKAIEDEADGFIDFSEDNPFSEEDY